MALSSFLTLGVVGLNCIAIVALFRATKGRNVPPWEN